jgi:hypothetical protein
LAENTQRASHIQAHKTVALLAKDASIVKRQASLVYEEGNQFVLL